MPRRRTYLKSITLKEEDIAKLREIAEEYNVSMADAVRLLYRYKDFEKVLLQAIAKLEDRFELLLKTLHRIEEKLDKLERRE